MPELREYVGPIGVSEFGRWFEVLDALAAAKVSIALGRLGEGNTSNLKAIGGGVAELRIHYGPGYRKAAKRQASK
jgi:putative addiction module killer protein